jgi:hypothetical protein
MPNTEVVIRDEMGLRVPSVPKVTMVDLSFGQRLTYTFSTPGSSAYGVITQAPKDSAPNKYDFGKPAEPPVLVLQPGQGPVFTGPDNSPIP